MIETEKTLRLQCIILNGTIISLKHDFHLILPTAPGNKKEEKCYEMFSTFKLSSSPLNLVKNVCKSYFKISKQISPVML